MNFNDDIHFFYADFGVDAVHTPKAGGAPTSGRVIFSQPGTVLIGGDVIATDLSARYQVSVFPAMRAGDALLINGASYRLRETPQLVEDGLEAIALLAKA